MQLVPQQQCKQTLRMLPLAAGADFGLVAPARTMLESHKPVVAVCAVRRRCGVGSFIFPFPPMPLPHACLT